MSVHVADTDSEQPILVDEMQHFVLCGENGLGQNPQSIQDNATLPKITQCEFTDHEGVRQDLPGIQQMHKRLIARAQMIDPY
jgi:hypothetical protein